jgi:hypothetical protein
LGLAQGPELQNRHQPEGANSPEALAYGGIPIQGRLTDAAGRPLPDGDYTLTFRLYELAVGGDPLCEDVDGPPDDPLHAVSVSGGLFSAFVDSCYADDLNGRWLYLGLEVEDDGEMSPRQLIGTVPYARSLQPGAEIVGGISSHPILRVENSSSADESYALGGHASAPSGMTGGVVGTTGSPDGYGGVFSGPDGDGDGAALFADGSGIIQSTAHSYLWISGNGLQKAVSDDTTRFEYDDYGGYKVYGGSDWGRFKRVVLPVTIPGQLYGQNVTVTGMDLYYTVSGDMTAIDAVILRRQDGVGAGAGILYDDSSLTCDVAQCTKHWDLTSNNVLSDERGILHLVLRLAFSGEAPYVQVGGVRLTLKHQ